MDGHGAGERRNFGGEAQAGQWFVVAAVWNGGIKLRWEGLSLPSSSPESPCLAFHELCGWGHGWPGCSRYPPTAVVVHGVGLLQSRRHLLAPSPLPSSLSRSRFSREILENENKRPRTWLCLWMPC